MRERSELARKGIARVGAWWRWPCRRCAVRRREPVAVTAEGHELYDRVGFAAVGRFNEFDNLRRGGIQYADTRGYAYARRDVTGRQLANVYAQTLGTIFTEQAKPYEVELCVAEVAHFGETKPPELYRITYDGSIADEPQFVVMGGTTEPIIEKLNESYTENAGLSDAAKIAIDALKAGANGEPRSLGPTTLEVAILDVNRPRRAFRRVTGAALEALLPEEGGRPRIVSSSTRCSKVEWTDEDQFGELSGHSSGVKWPASKAECLFDVGEVVRPPGPTTRWGTADHVAATAHRWARES